MKLFAYNSEGALHVQYTCVIVTDCSPEMPRRNRIPFEHRERIVRAFEDVKRDEARRQGIAL